MGLGTNYVDQPGSGAPINPAMFGGGPAGLGAGVGPDAPAPFDPYNLPAQATVGADGTAVISLEPVNALRLVTRGVVTNDGAALCSAFIYVGSIDPKNLRDLTPLGNADVFDEINPIRVAPNQPLLVAWTGATVGSLCTVSLDYWQQRTL